MMSHLFLYRDHPLILTFFFIFFFFIALPAQSKIETNPNCVLQTCGDVNISYPFWKMDYDQSDAQFCGYEGFGIKCFDEGQHQNISSIKLDDDSYYVSEINYTLGTIYLADFDVSPVAVVQETCPKVDHNISLGSLPFNYSTHSVNISFHFDCINGCPDFAHEIPCMSNNEKKSCVHVMNKTMDEYRTWEEFECDKVVVTAGYKENIDRVMTNLNTGFKNVLEQGFALQWKRMDKCDKCENSGGKCGNHSTTGFTCFCPDGTTTNRVDCKPGPRINLRRELVIGVGSTVLSFVVIFTICCILKPPSHNCVASLKHKSEDEKNIEAFVMQYGSLSMKRYKYSDIKKMTNSFKVKLGQGGFGQVFKGKLLDGRLVAVKLLNSSKANGQEFINEVASIGRTSHVNIVTLLGFCFEYKKRALVYEYMSNGSLEKFIHSGVQISNDHIGVKKLYEIALGIARGLDYLHRGCNTRILHLDIKPHNILLDEDFCPKIADFGLAKLYSRKESIVSMLEARGTIGYIAPEVYNKNFGGVSHKSDVYSYGMLLLEMVGGRKNVDVGVGSGRTSEIYFPDWIYNRLHKDEFLLDSVTTTEENDYARKMTIVGLWCIQPAPNQRPTINEVIEMLERSTEALEVPPKPFFSSPSRSPPTIYSTSESITNIT